MDNQETSLSQPQIQPQLTSDFPWIKIFLILLVVAISLGIGGYVLGTKKNQSISQKQQVISPTIQPSPTTDPTANWKTYQGEGFTFKYSDSWKLDSSNLITSRLTNKKSGGDYTPGVGG